MSPKLTIIDLEAGFPDRIQALRKLESALAEARKKQVSVMKIVHGYGSSGVGGILRPVVRNFLRQAKEKGDIRLFVTGESFSSFDQRSKDLIHEAPQLLLDSDLGGGNKGITLVLLGASKLTSESASASASESAPGEPATAASSAPSRTAGTRSWRRDEHLVHVARH